MSAARRMKKSYIRPAYANAVDGKVLYFPFVCIYNGRIRTNSGSAYNQVEAYIPFPSTAHPLHISARETGIHPHTRTTSSGQKASIASLYTFPVHSGQPSFVKKHSRKKPGNVYHNKDTITARKNKKRCQLQGIQGSNRPIPA